ncbi:hypothetical protein DM01DRAFT_1066204 [Hesseltinella vesiculosa]|uniref:Uncharacterized protein n=1 Tax=Hesseltinella vesiculosa TaxID=101127 RepID=A0A1X2GFQ3_9FUNG|nr:hypothetical protein DM01DRAFT_1066204 [Hesseltinella vesiculosa]
MGSKHDYDANELLYAIRTCYKSNHTIFSLDMIHAVQRQRKFYDAVMRMSSWDDVHRFSNAIRRYHDFLYLMKTNPSMIAVPTIEIDAAWHTHMLCSAHYRHFGLHYMQRVINHDDTIPETKLAQHATATNSAWSNCKLQYILKKPVKFSPKDDNKSYLSIIATLGTTVETFGVDYYAGQVEIEDPIPTDLRDDLNKKLTDDYTYKDTSVQASHHSTQLRKKG